ncbi:MAG TPA: phosphodiester glycosidase family protein [Chthoniobacterales bacterium]|nr:phosphodiester glycosidase family protein [Chthoniobacterales bacterium]
MAARIALVAALLFLLRAISADAAWTVASSESEPGTAAGVERRHIIVSGATGDEARLELALFSSKSATVRVVDNPSGDELGSVASRLRALAGVNGGYFDPQNAPVGLVIGDGKMIAPFRKAKLLSGVLVVNRNRVELMRSAEYSPRKNTIAALQCGPFLVDGGTPVAGLNNTRPARRTFFFTSGSDRAGIGFCSSVTLAEMGEILATPRLAGDLKVQRALNFDGGSSSAFWFAGEKGVFSIGELKTVRNFVVLTPK